MSWFQFLVLLLRVMPPSTISHFCLCSAAQSWDGVPHLDLSLIWWNYNCRPFMNLFFFYWLTSCLISWFWKWVVLCRPGWPWTCRDRLVSVSWMLGLSVCHHAQFGISFWNKDFLPHSFPRRSILKPLVHKSPRVFILFNAFFCLFTWVEWFICVQIYFISLHFMLAGN